MAKLRQSGEDYLETILILSKRGEVRSIDIANEMNVSKPSVCRAVGILKNGGFILVDKSGYITFTAAGKEIAEKIYERHTVLTDWLVGIGVDEITAEEDACRLEHNFSSQSFEKLKNHINIFHNKNVAEQK
ncbi:MAG: metal-dependent transcriptional regulator [Eubacterium sp.]|nr:metal-dependent transcriptional regulator [Eubacterium sp.]